MAAFFANAAPFSDVRCTICTEAFSDHSELTAVTLKCGDKFHLDCIGFMFNAFGAMQCPNCGALEHGEWRVFGQVPGGGGGGGEDEDEDEDDDEDEDEDEETDLDEFSSTTEDEVTTKAK